MLIIVPVGLIVSILVWSLKICMADDSKKTGKQQQRSEQIDNMSRRPIRDQIQSGPIRDQIQSGPIRGQIQPGNCGVEQHAAQDTSTNTLTNEAFLSTEKRPSCQEDTPLYEEDIKDQPKKSAMSQHDVDKVLINID
eukprot:GFUD01046894.1.p1 GENE.GFUD01046894.1~~GFUD01046894.1.p1  ORF type:complete len:155 (-),score=43.13 GFUD01046894.1:114-524(-)